MRLAMLLPAALALTGCARQGAVPDGAELIKQAHAFTDGATVTVEQTNLVLEDGRPRYSYSRIVRNGPDQVRAEILAGDGVSVGSGPVVIIRTGTHRTVYSPRLGVARSTNLPATDTTMGGRLDLLLRNYQPVTMGKENVSGSPAWLLELRPLHEGRPLTRVWLDVKSLSPVRQEEWGPNGQLLSISQASKSPMTTRARLRSSAFPTPAEAGVRGASADATQSMPAAALTKAIGFVPGRLSYVPEGFRHVGTFLYTCPSTMKPCARWELTDGRVSVSIFQARQTPESATGGSRFHDARGPIVALTSGPYQILVRGGLPEKELARIAHGLQPR